MSGYCKRCGKHIKRRTYCSKACAGMDRRTHNPQYYPHSGGITEHVAIAEGALGHRLPIGAEVHHVDGCRRNNAHTNLVICQDHAYHCLLHYRAKAQAACGDPSKLYCAFCKKWDCEERLYVRNGGREGRKVYHVACVVQYNRELIARRQQ